MASSLKDAIKARTAQPTRGRFVATAGLAKWCAEQFVETRCLTSPDQRAAMADAAESLIAELKELTKVLG